jgi:uncharacterized phage-associated protein
MVVKNVSLKLVESNCQKNYPDVEKFKETFLYILQQTYDKPHVTKMIIYRLFYFIDFDYYEKYKNKLIGATYIKNSFGPAPVEFNKIVNQMININETRKIESEGFDKFEYIKTFYVPIRKPNLVIFDVNEMEIINKVINNLSKMSFERITKYAYSDAPWRLTKNGDVIDYNKVFRRKSKHSVSTNVIYL